MPLDVLGRTRATLIGSSSLQPCPIGLGNLVNAHRARDRLLQFSILNEEFLVNACHQQALNTFLVFVHTARRCYRLNGSMSSKEFGWFTIRSNYLKLYHLEEAKVVTRYQ